MLHSIESAAALPIMMTRIGAITGGLADAFTGTTLDHIAGCVQAP